MFALFVDCRLIACVSCFHPRQLECYLSPILGRHSPGQRPFISHARTEMSYLAKPMLSIFLYTAIFRIHWWITYHPLWNRSAVVHYVHELLLCCRLLSYGELKYADAVGRNHIISHQNFYSKLTADENLRLCKK